MIEEMEYAVPLTKEELLLSAEIAGTISKQITKKELEFDKIKRNFRDSIADLRNALRLHLQKMETKKETRFVKLEVKYNQPTDGKKQIFSEAGELYETADMTDDDWQNIFVASETEETQRPAVVLYPAKSEQDQICDKCGAVGLGNRVLKLDRDRKLCLICVAKANDKKWASVMACHKAGHQVLFRVMFLKGVTKFTFMGAGHNWGKPIYKEGDYQEAGSSAADFYKTLQDLDNFKED